MRKRSILKEELSGILLISESKEKEVLLSIIFEKKARRRRFQGVSVTLKQNVGERTVKSFQSSVTNNFKFAIFVF